MVDAREIERTSAPDGTRRTLKRRGILAAASAVIAGIVAKQTSRPVLAANPLLIGTFNSTPDGQTTQLTGNVGNAGLVDLQNGPADRGHGLTVSSAHGYGVVAGTASLIDSFGTPLAGVIGSGPGIGVMGTNNGTGAGIGVQGQTTNGIGVEGNVFVTSTVANTIGVFGNNLSSGANGIGVYGSSANGTGVYGQTATSYQYGVLGTTYAPNSTAIAGTCTGNGSSAFSGGTGNANAFAAYFQGHVQVDGPFDVIGAGNKHAAVAHPDGSHRTVYSMESPEAWLEDFGTGTLVGGQATVELDADFAALIHTDDYHVFLTSHGDYHVHTPQRSATGFMVQVTSGAGVAVKGAATVGGTFSWRVVARPKTAAKVDRLAKVNLADAKALLPDPAKLPKPVSPPVATTPPKP